MNKWLSKSQKKRKITNRLSLLFVCNHIEQSGKRISRISAGLRVLILIPKRKRLSRNKIKLLVQIIGHYHLSKLNTLALVRTACNFQDFSSADRYFAKFD